MEAKITSQRTKGWQICRYLCLTLILTWAVVRFAQRDYPHAVQAVCIFALVASGAASFSPPKRDSLGRIISVGIFVAAAAVLVSTLVILSLK